MSQPNENKPVSLTSDLTVLNGIGEKTAGLFRQCGIENISDLIHAYPRTYDRYDDPVPISDLSAGEVQTITGTITGPVRMGRNRKLAAISTIVSDISGKINVSWFRLPYLKKTLHSGQAVILRGICSYTSRGLTLTQPEIFLSNEKYLQKLHTMQPVYRRVSGLSNQTFIKAVRQALQLVDLEADPVDAQVLSAFHLIDADKAIRSVHFPENDDEFRKGRERLCFDEFLLFILRLRFYGQQQKDLPDALPILPGSMTEQLQSSLPYQLTSGQREALNAIYEDMSRTKAMSRLVQGDVGCGKTILSVLALLAAVDSGGQGALMAPTQVLAVQHYHTITDLFKQYDIPCPVSLLTGTTPASEKKAIYEKMSRGEPGIFIGTQTLIQKKAAFDNLTLVITDEQHRFGVRQRTALAEKGNKAASPHILVMSATPIPRTLGIILYGDLSISAIHEMPAGRLPVKNAVIQSDDRQKAFNFIKKEIDKGRQAYCICPLVEDSDSVAAESVTGYIDSLRTSLGSSVRVEMLHGRIKGSEKDRILHEFSEGKIDVLVSTTVIEVGINVPNATVMLIENADRFGLAQLHQLRGRIGRGHEQSYCIFLTSRHDPKALERLNVIGRCNDGFEIAQEDLRLRGPGDLFGLAQSGFLSFEIGDIYQDHDVLLKASQAADMILEEDPSLSADQHGMLKELVLKGNQISLSETERTL